MKNRIEALEKMLKLVNEGIDFWEHGFSDGCIQNLRATKELVLEQLEILRNHNPQPANCIMTGGER